MSLRTAGTPHTDGLIEERLERITLPFEAKYNAKVRTYLKDYLVNGYRQTEDILGRTVMYFPIFEHYLTIYGLPKELMYLAIVESALDPTAKSPVGAAGLWQLMPHTARQYGLRVDGAVDERFDPYRSTEAAVRLLADLYKDYRDWRLVSGGLQLWYR
ncbi:MAG: lytic transglycosylase domain-containing protein [Alphaproteobacteria bacterium]|nr:lytic transglycosylase domain-containing protein [Alphaproteobacteria bacterium]